VANRTTSQPAPQLRETPLIGQTFAFNKDRLGTLQRVAAECGDIGSFRVGPLRFVLVNSSELIHAALVARDGDFVKGWLQTQALKPVFGYGLSSSEGEFHRGQRKLLQPAFQPCRLASYAETMVAYNQDMAQGIADGVTVDFAQEMGRLTMSIVGKAMFNADVFSEATEMGAAITIAGLFLIPIRYGAAINWARANNGSPLRDCRSTSANWY
jgi:cytochrome P450